jgi:hypothetical protein
MATANDGISRFSDSTIYGIPTFNKGIALGDGSDITLSNGLTPPTVGQLGYIKVANLTTVALVSGAAGVETGTITLDPGTYIVSVDYAFNLTGATVSQAEGSIFVAGVVRSTQLNCPTTSATVTGVVYQNMTTVLNITASTIISFRQAATVSAGTISSILEPGRTEINAMRIA